MLQRVFPKIYSKNRGLLQPQMLPPMHQKTHPRQRIKLLQAYQMIFSNAPDLEQPLVVLPVVVGVRLVLWALAVHLERARPLVD
jgi:hypothetical protein